MKSDWRKVKLDEILDLLYGKGLPERVRINGEYPVYGSGGIVGYHNEYLVKGPGIIVGRKGSIGSIFYERNNFYPIDTVYYVQPKSNKYDLRYQYYLLQSLNLKELNSDAAVPGLNRDIAYSQKTIIPDFPTQGRIASILSAYDDLIENNNCRIKILEQMAQMIYREWFVDFRFPASAKATAGKPGYEKVKMVDSKLGRMPEGWEVKKLGDVLDLIYGDALKAEDRIDGPIPVYGSSGIIGYHNESKAKGPGIIVGRKGNVGSVFWSDDDFFPIDTAYYIQTDKSLLYIYYNLLTQNFINNDAAVPGLNRKQALGLPIVVPGDEIVNKFELIVLPIFKNIKRNKQINDKLRQTRDLLLPKLVGGEVEV